MGNAAYCSTSMPSDLNVWKYKSLTSFRCTPNSERLRDVSVCTSVSWSVYRPPNPFITSAWRALFYFCPNTQYSLKTAAPTYCLKLKFSEIAVICGPAEGFFMFIIVFFSLSMINHFYFSKKDHWNQINFNFTQWPCCNHNNAPTSPRKDYLIR